MISDCVCLRACRISLSSHDAASKEVLLRVVVVLLFALGSEPPPALLGLDGAAAMRLENGVYGMILLRVVVVVVVAMARLCFGIERESVCWRPGRRLWIAKNQRRWDTPPATLVVNFEFGSCGTLAPLRCSVGVTHALNVPRANDRAWNFRFARWPRVTLEFNSSRFIVNGLVRAPARSSAVYLSLSPVIYVMVVATVTTGRAWCLNNWLSIDCVK
jgi:hypothetical protein